MRHDPIKLLLIDDSPRQATAEVAALSRGGYRVVAVSSLIEGLQHVQEHAVDLILLTGHFADGEVSTAFAARLRDRGMDLPVLIVRQMGDLAVPRTGMPPRVYDLVVESPHYLDFLHEGVRQVLRRDRVEEQLFESQSFLGAIVGSVQDAVILVSADGQIQVFNPAAEKMFRCTAATVIGSDLRQLVPQSLESCSESFPRVPRAPEVGIRQDGEHFPLEAQVAACEVHGQIHYTFVLRDLSTQRRLDHERFRSQRIESIGRIAGAVAHDLNNVLTPIALSLDLLRSSVRDPAGLNLLESLHSNARRGAAMVRQILSFARGADSEHQPIQLPDLIYQLQRALISVFPSSLSVRIDLPHDLPMISGDLIQIEQVFMNLFVNASDAMARGGELRISAARVEVDEAFVAMKPHAKPGSYVRVSVTDTGRGIPTELRSKIFEPFFTTKAPGEGSGLGLSTVLQIVQGHGGFLTFSSTVGQGSDFQVYLPISMTNLPGDLPSDGEIPHDGAGEWILAVDDEEEVRKVLAMMLEAHGYQVRTAHQGAEAVAILAEHRGQFRAAILDVVMPVLDGPATACALRALQPGLPVIAVSGYAEPRNRAEFLPDRWLRKPFTANELLTLLAEVVDRVPPPHPVDRPPNPYTLVTT